jgi:hypothetical protein
VRENRFADVGRQHIPRYTARPRLLADVARCQPLTRTPLGLAMVVVVVAAASDWIPGGNRSARDIGYQSYGGNNPGRGW